MAEGIFVKPSSLQEALAYPPGSRTAEHITAIGCVLKLIPLFHSTEDQALQELAAVAEYRTFTGTSDILTQDYPASCIGIVLRGSVQVRMDMDDAAMAASFQNPSNLILDR